MDLLRYVEVLHLLGDENRLRLCALLRERELTVTDLVRVTGISQSRVSTHLGRLREGGVVRDRRDGAHAFYTLAGETMVPAAHSLLTAATATDDPTLAQDKQRLVELDAERRGQLPASFAGEMERKYSPGRTWQSLAIGLSGLLRLGDVLDVGSGDGVVASVLAPHCRSVTCIDVSERMIDAAKVRLAAHAHVKAQRADVHELPFESESFDAVLMFHTLTYVEQPHVALRECARVLRLGGRLVLLTLDQHGRTEITAAYGERHPGFAPSALNALMKRAGMTVLSSETACRETKKPHFQVVRAIAEKATNKAPLS